MLFGSFSFSILISIVAISIASKRRPPRPRSQPLSPPLPASNPQTHAALVRGEEKGFRTHSHRIEQCAVHVLGGGQAPRIAEEAAGEGDGMGGHGDLWRL